MAHITWNEIDDQQYNFEDYYCAFLDILGYKYSMKLFFQGKFNLFGRIQRAMRFAGVETSPQNSPDKIITRIFSDSIILTAPKSDVDICCFLNYIGQLTTYFGLEGLFLRGGVSCGKLFEITENSDNNYSFLAAEGLVKAYQMEMTAVYPMIVIDDNIISDITLSDFVVMNETKYIFNNANFIINAQANNETDIIAELQELIDKKDSFSDVHIREKYEWLINYYLWYIEVCQKKYGKFDLSRFAPFDKEKKMKYIFQEL